MTRRIIAVLFFALALGACGKKKDKSDKYGKVAVKMAETTSTALATSAPDTFKVRAMYFLVGNFNETTASWAGGQAFKVYWYPSCVTSSTGSNGQTYDSPLDDGPCAAKMAADASGGYLDLAAGTTAVNAALNAQASQVPAGTYTHFEFALLGSQQAGNNTYENFSWTHSSVTGVQTYALKKTEYIEKFDTPLTLAEGDSVVATINYDLSAVITTATMGASGTSNDCVNDASGTQTCAAMPALTIGVAKAN